MVTVAAEKDGIHLDHEDSLVNAALFGFNGMAVDMVVGMVAAASVVPVLSSRTSLGSWSEWDDEKSPQWQQKL